MKAIYISDDLHRRAKQRAAEMGLPLKDLIEKWVERGVREIPSETPVSLREPEAVYQTTMPVETMPPTPRVRTLEARTFLAELEHQGTLISGERLQEHLQAERLALQKILGIMAPPSVKPPTIEEVRAIFRRQRELHPEIPSLTELLRQMREEE